MTMKATLFHTKQYIVTVQGSDHSNLAPMQLLFNYPHMATSIGHYLIAQQSRCHPFPISSTQIMYSQCLVHLSARLLLIAIYYFVLFALFSTCYITQVYLYISRRPIN